MTEDMTAHTMAHSFVPPLFLHLWHSTACLMTDNDLAFTSEVVQELCNLFGLKRVCTSAYHPNPMEPLSDYTSNGH